METNNSAPVIYVLQDTYKANNEEMQDVYVELDLSAAKAKAIRLMKASIDEMEGNLPYWAEDDRTDFWKSWDEAAEGNELSRAQDLLMEAFEGGDFYPMCSVFVCTPGDDSSARVI